MTDFELQLRALIEQCRESGGSINDIYQALEEVTADVYAEVRNLGPFAPKGQEQDLP